MAATSRAYFVHTSTTACEVGVDTMQIVPAVGHWVPMLPLLPAAETVIRYEYWS